MSTSAYDPRHALNAICPYFTMFPLEYPLSILKKHKSDSPIVYDPFCGRGTTIYAARTMGLSSWGVDTSPIAVAIAKAKLATASFEDIIELAEKLIKKSAKDIPKTPFFRNAYHSKTLHELCALREGLLAIKVETGASILLRAATLGCLHGPLTKKLENSGYFSNQMPRTFSSKPDYSVRYWKQRGMKAPNVRVVDVLQRKLARIDLEADCTGDFQQILCSNSQFANTYRKLPNDISLVVTSPPYFGMKTYIQDQWLRKWFLGGEETVDYATGAQLDHSSHEVFAKSLAKVWKNIHKSEADQLDLYIRFGGVPSRTSDAKQLLKASLEEAKGWKVISVRNAKTAHAGNRQADQMSFGSHADTEFDFHAVRA